MSRSHNVVKKYVKVTTHSPPTPSGQETSLAWLHTLLLTSNSRPPGHLCQVGNPLEHLQNPAHPRGSRKWPSPLLPVQSNVVPEKRKCLVSCKLYLCCCYFFFNKDVFFMLIFKRLQVDPLKNVFWSILYFMKMEFLFWNRPTGWIVSQIYRAARLKYVFCVS